MNDDMMAMPRPLPDTMKISTNSLRRLKYWATINVEQSRVIPTPTPITAAGERGDALGIVGVQGPGILTVAKEKLMELGSKGREETSQRRY